MVSLPLLFFALASSFSGSTSAQTVIVTLGHTISVGSSMAINIDGTRLTSGTTATIGSIPVFISKSDLIVGSTSLPILPSHTLSPGSPSKNTDAPEPPVITTPHSTPKSEKSTSLTTSHTVLPIPVPVPVPQPKNPPPGQPEVHPPPPPPEPPAIAPPSPPAPPVIPPLPPLQIPHGGLPNPFQGHPKPKPDPDPKPDTPDTPPKASPKSSPDPTTKPSSSHSTTTTSSTSSCSAKTVSACTTIYLASQHTPHTTICSKITTNCSETCTSNICSHTSFTVAPMQTDGIRLLQPPAFDEKAASAQASWMQQILDPGETSKSSQSTKLVQSTKAAKTSKVESTQSPTSHVNPTIGNPASYVLTWKPSAASAGPECEGGYCPQT